MRSANGQNILDIAIIGTGNIENVVDVCDANGISITDDIVAGVDFIIPNNIVIAPSVIKYFSLSNQKPATGGYLTDGINYDRIEYEFTVR